MFYYVLFTHNNLTIGINKIMLDKNMYYTQFKENKTCLTRIF